MTARGFFQLVAMNSYTHIYLRWRYAIWQIPFAIATMSRKNNFTDQDRFWPYFCLDLEQKMHDLIGLMDYPQERASDV